MNAGTGKRFFALDAFRGIMACTVVLLHTIVDTPWLASSLVRNSHIAVDFFFILSGFVICINYSTKLESVVDLKKYAVKRFFRLWPLHLVIMCLFLIIRTFDYVAFRLGFGEDSIVFSDLILFVKELFFLHVLEQGVPMQWNFPAWSISAEIIAYLVFAFLAFGLRSRFVFGMVAVFILSFFFGFILKNYGSMIDTKALRAVTGFCLGAIVAELFFHRRIVQYRIPSILEFIALILLFLNFKFYGILGSMAYPIMLASFTATLTIFAYEGGLISRMLKAWPFQKLGLYSYGIYMVHAIVMEVVGKLASVIEKASGISLHTISSYSNFREGKLLINLGNPYLNFFMPILILLLVVFVAGISNKMIEIPWMEKSSKFTLSIR